MHTIKRALLTLTAIAAVVAVTAPCVAQVPNTIARPLVIDADGELNRSFIVPDGKTITIASGGSLTFNSGALLTLPTLETPSDDTLLKIYNTGHSSTNSPLVELGSTSTGYTGDVLRIVSEAGTVAAINEGGDITATSYSGGFLFLQAGSVSAPALCKTGDTNAGLYFPGDDQIAYASGGVQKFRFDSDGFTIIGSGTTSKRYFSAFDGVGYTLSTGYTSGSRMAFGFGDPLSVSIGRFERNTSTGEIQYTTQAVSGAHFGTVLGHAGAKQYIRAAASPTVSPLEVQNSAGTAQVSVTPDFTLQMLQIASPGSPASPAINSARIYAKDNGGTAEIFVMDEGGNETQISPHAADAPEWLVDEGDYGPDRVVREVNIYTGRVRYTNETRRARLAELTVAAVTGDADALAALKGLSEQARKVVYEEDFATHNTRLSRNLVAHDWDTVQQNHAIERKRQQTAFDTARTDAQKAHDAWRALPAEKRAEIAEPTVPPAEDRPPDYVAEPKPDWLREDEVEQDGASAGGKAR